MAYLNKDRLGEKSTKQFPLALFVLFCLNMRELAQTLKVCLSFFLPRGPELYHKIKKAQMFLQTSDTNFILCVFGSKGLFDENTAQMH